jgi:PAS domain-containing protein
MAATIHARARAHSGAQHAAPDEPRHAAAKSPGETAADAAIADIHRRATCGWRAFVTFHVLLAATLAGAYRTWRVTAVVIVMAAGSFAAALWRRPGSLLTRVLAGIALQAFVALHIYQMGGLAEMYYFFFTATTGLVIYQDRRAIWPGFLALMAEHTLVSVWQPWGERPEGYPLLDGELDVRRIALHYGLALIQAAIASHWAELLCRRTRQAAAAQQVLETQAAEREALLRAESAARAAAERSQAELAAVLHQMPIAVWLADSTGQVTQVNHAVEAMWGVARLLPSPREYAEYEAYWPAGHPKAGQRLTSHDWALARALAGESVVRQVVDYVRFDTGEVRQGLNSGSTIRDAAGEGEWRRRHHGRRHRAGGHAPGAGHRAAGRRGEARRGRGSEPGEGPVPGHHEPRAAHPTERHLGPHPAGRDGPLRPRHRGAAGRHGAGPEGPAGTSWASSRTSSTTPNWRAGRVEYDIASSLVREVVNDVRPLVEPQMAARGVELVSAIPTDAGPTRSRCGRTARSWPRCWSTS